MMRHADEDRCGGRNTMTRDADEDMCSGNEDFDPTQVYGTEYWRTEAAKAGLLFQPSPSSPLSDEQDASLT